MSFPQISKTYQYWDSWILICIDIFQVWFTWKIWISFVHTSRIPPCPRTPPPPMLTSWENPWLQQAWHSLLKQAGAVQGWYVGGKFIADNLALYTVRTSYKGGGTWVVLEARWAAHKPNSHISLVCCSRKAMPPWCDYVLQSGCVKDFVPPPKMPPNPPLPRRRDLATNISVQ